MRVLIPFLLLVPVCTLPCLAPAQTAQPRTRPVAAAKDSAAASDDLRVTHVSLYKNGIGFFEHRGRVTGDASVRLSLTSAQLDDVLQTLTAVDLGGGHITGANYNSTTPLDQQLRNIPLSLGEQPTEQDLYDALRGARVEVTGSGPVFTGRILALEDRTPPQPDDSNAKPLPERRILTVVADTGATRSLDLTPLTTVRLLDGGLRTDLNTYLELLDRNRSEGVRHVTLTDRGSGTRELRVSFLSEVPVWKSTYRLLMTGGPQGAGRPGDGQRATLQGFSVVDNTTGEDWKDVHLSLIAGNPQSFLQPLAQPIYDRRPEIPIAENAQLTPQTHDSAIPAPPPPPGSASAALSSGAGGNPSSLGGPPTWIGSGASGGIAGSRRTRMKDTGPPPPPASQSVMVNGFTGGALTALAPYETIARASTAPNTTTAAFDDFFAYNLADPVTIPRNGSALVPILQVQLPAERVTLWSPAQPQPLRAVWITNDSHLTLDRGSFSVVEDGAFAGEGLLDPVHPGERRLLSYAADQAVRVTPTDRRDSRRVTSISVAKGVLRATNAEVTDVEYLVSNAASEPRTVILEEPRRPGWTLGADAKPAETTPSVYRFRVEAPPHDTARLHITQRHTVDQYFRLADSSEEQLTLYLRDNNASPALLAQLQPIFEGKRRVAALDAQISDKQTAIQTIVDDQNRLRENLKALKGSPEERSLARRYTGELNAQEDSLATLHSELSSLQQQRATAAADLAQRIENLQIAPLE